MTQAPARLALKRFHFRTTSLGHSAGQFMGTENAVDRALFAALWLALAGFWLLLAPPPTADLFAEVKALALADTAAVDPIAIAVFNLLGVIPTAFLALLLFETGRPKPGPFALGSYFLGGFILLPYLALRDTRAPLDPAPGTFVRLIGSRLVGAMLLIAALGLVGFAMLAGSPAAYAAQFRDSQFVAVMSIDFLVLVVALHRVSVIDRRRRALHFSGALAKAVHLPLLGPMLYLAFRQPQRAGHSKGTPEQPNSRPDSEV